MARIRYISTFFALIFAIIPMVAQASFNLVPPRTVIEGNKFSLTFRLTDGQANPPSAPQLEGCTLLYGPSTSTMHSTQIINGKASSTNQVDYTFTYRADKAGTVTIPEVTISCEGKTLRSNTGTLNILPPDQNSQAQNGQNNNPTRIDDITTQTPGQISANDIMVRIFFSKNSVYEQEPVIATIKVFTKYDISSFLPTTQPAFEGFLCEELPVSLETNIEHYNGQNYHTAVLKRVLLYPQKSGKLTINSGKYDITLVQYEQINMGFYRTSRPVEREITTSSNAATINVKALPQPAPTGFSGAVGQFKVETTLEPELLRTNDAAVYSYKITGSGNIKYLAEPIFDFPAGIEVYTPKTDINARVNNSGNNMTGTYTSEVTIVPQEVGNFEIPQSEFVYFDIANEKYQTIEIPAIPFRVLAGSASASPTQPKPIDGTIDDILHIRPSDSETQQHNPEYTFLSTFYWILYIVIALALTTVIIIYRRQIRLQADVTGRKLAKAGRVATKRLKEAKGFLSRHENDAFYAALSKALWGYISDKLSIPPSQLRRDNVAEKLRAYGLDEDNVNNVLEILDNCEMARFTPGTDLEAEENYTNAVAAIKSIEDAK